MQSSGPLDKSGLGRDIQQEGDRIDVVDKEEVANEEDEGKGKYEGEGRRM